MKLVILVVEDEPEVRDAVVGDLAPFAQVARIEPADVEDAWEVVAEAEADGDALARSWPTTVCRAARAWTCWWR